MSSAMTHWSRKPFVRDVALATLLLIGTLAIGDTLERFRTGGSTFGQAGAGDVEHVPMVWWVATAGQLIALLVWRRWPIPALVVAIAGTLTQMGVAAGAGFINLAAPIILGGIAIGYRRTVSLIVLFAALGVAVGWTLYVLSVTGDQPKATIRVGDLNDDQLARVRLPDEPEPEPELVRPNFKDEEVRVEETGPEDWGGLVALAPALIAGWGIGSSLRSRRAYLDELHARARDLERERDQQSALAAATERSRITRELHDVVAHGLSVMVVQAQGGAAALDNRPTDTRQALDAIIDTGRRSLADMRRALGVVGAAADGDVDGRHPQPGLGDLPRLIRDVGTPVLLHVEGTPVTLPAAVDLSAYRIVQEAVTNTVKHAGRGARTQVFLSYGKKLVKVEVSDNGDGTSTSDNGGGDDGGSGLRGMRERAELLGGTFAAGPGPNGGFFVRASLPIGEPEK